MTTHEPAAGARAAPDLTARLDRLPWNGLHSTILIALGAGWLFDSLEVQLFGSAVGPLGDHFDASVFQRNAILAVWLTGILLGALAGGHLADRFGRRRLFVITLLWYAGFTVLTGLSPTLDFVYGFRFLAALGVGAEYAIVNAAIAELMPALRPSPNCSPPTCAAVSMPPPARWSRWTARPPESPSPHHPGDL